MEPAGRAGMQAALRHLEGRAQLELCSARSFSACRPGAVRYAATKSFCDALYLWVPKVPSATSFLIS
jgi:hypothetical protein